MENPYINPTQPQAPDPYQTPQPQYQVPQPQYRVPQYQVPQPQYQVPQYQTPQPQYQIPQYQPAQQQYQPQQAPQPYKPALRTDLVRELAPAGKPFDTWRFYRPLTRWGWIILAVSGGISVLTLILVAGGVI